MTGGFDSFLALPGRDRWDVFEEAASRLDTLPNYVEKDFWVCLVLDAPFNRRPEGRPSLFFKGGTSLSKAFGLIWPTTIRTPGQSSCRRPRWQPRRQV